MNFSSYMEQWLYGETGYYKNFKAIGKSGDFYTAVSASAFFGASIANYFYQLILEKRADRNGWLIEIGAHQGYLLCDMIQWLYSCDPALIGTLNFAIVERQPELRRAQQEYIQGRFGDDVTVQFFDDIADVAVDYAFVVANEILDAFPCELLKEKKIATVEESAIAWEEAPDALLLWAQKHHLTQGEIAVGYEEFASHMGEGIGCCDFVTFDYGEKYVRNDFSVRIYRGHETLPLFDDEVLLKEVYQKADITYDVNFGHVIEAFEGAGFETIGYETQARALVRFGVIDILEQYAKMAKKSDYLREAGRIKTLIAPTIMGDRFKMLHVRK